MKIPEFKSFCIVAVVFLTLGFWKLQAQSQRQLQLEEQRRELQKEIRQITLMLFAGKKEQKSVVSTVENLNHKISVRKNLIRITNQQANLLSRKINRNQEEISIKRDKLKRIKNQWRAYFHHNAHSHINSAVQYFAKRPGYVM